MTSGKLGICVPGLDAFIDAASTIAENQGLEPEGGAYRADAKDWRRMAAYLRADWAPQLEAFPTCLNADKDWKLVEDAYLRGSPEMLFIDDFLSPQALAAFQAYALEARVWNTEYRGKYLGAFAAQGFVTPLHLQLATELRSRMPRVFGPHALNQLWAFKYDARLGTGIGVHADFAAVNLNFWITPDHFNLDPDAGGLKVYHVPAPPSWTFDQYNHRVDRIYEFLAKTRSDCLTVPYRCNRAVLFNSALFHETDRIDFVDRYEGRRVNMTYLFGRQLT
jgi:hypothetical protein